MRARGRQPGTDARARASTPAEARPGERRRGRARRRAWRRATRRGAWPPWLRTRVREMWCEPRKHHDSTSRVDPTWQSRRIHHRFRTSSSPLPTTRWSSPSRPRVFWRPPRAQRRPRSAAPSSPPRRRARARRVASRGSASLARPAAAAMFRLPPFSPLAATRTRSRRWTSTPWALPATITRWTPRRFLPPRETSRRRTRPRLLPRTHPHPRTRMTRKSDDACARRIPPTRWRRS